MRTTIEITDEAHEAISAIARRLGLRGLSEVVQTAIDAYLGSVSAEAVEAVLGLEGSIPEETAEEMRTSMQETRSAWR